MSIAERAGGGLQSPRRLWSPSVMRLGSDASAPLAVAEPCSSGRVVPEVVPEISQQSLKCHRGTAVIEPWILHGVSIESHLDSP